MFPTTTTIIHNFSNSQLSFEEILKGFFCCCCFLISTHIFTASDTLLSSVQSQVSTGTVVLPLAECALNVSWWRLPNTSTAANILSDFPPLWCPSSVVFAFGHDASVISAQILSSVLVCLSASSLAAAFLFFTGFQQFDLMCHGVDFFVLILFGIP